MEPLRVAVAVRGELRVSPQSILLDSVPDFPNLYLPPIQSNQLATSQAQPSAQHYPRLEAGCPRHQKLDSQDATPPSLRSISSLQNLHQFTIILPHRAPPRIQSLQPLTLERMVPDASIPPHPRDERLQEDVRNTGAPGSKAQGEQDNHQAFRVEQVEGWSFNMLEGKNMPIPPSPCGIPEPPFDLLHLPQEQTDRHEAPQSSSLRGKSLFSRPRVRQAKGKRVKPRVGVTLKVMDSSEDKDEEVEDNKAGSASTITEPQMPKREEVEDDELWELLLDVWGMDIKDDNAASASNTSVAPSMEHTAVQMPKNKDTTFESGTSQT
ncbi:Nn.00g062270.m01.CDS01 [Neocucurbitaria sp. VM-36]